MMHYNQQLICPMEYPMFEESNDVPINRYGILFLIEKELANVPKQFKDFNPESIFLILKDLLCQSVDSSIMPLCDLVGVHQDELRNIFSDLIDFKPDVDQFHSILLEETLIYFNDEIHELCQFVRNRQKYGKESVFLDTEPQFTVSFTPYPDFDDYFCGEMAYGELH